MRFIDEDFQPCVCGHDGAFHCKQYSNISGDTNIFIGYLHCEWNGKWGTAKWGEDACTCKQFKVDNLRMLERLSE